MGPGFNPDAAYMEELQRVYGSLAVGALPPGMTPIPNVFPPPPNIGADAVQRERERLGNCFIYVVLLFYSSLCCFVVWWCYIGISCIVRCWPSYYYTPKHCAVSVKNCSCFHR